jgi:hypothetical protein
MSVLWHGGNCQCAKCERWRVWSGRAIAAGNGLALISFAVIRLIIILFTLRWAAAEYYITTHCIMVLGHQSLPLNPGDGISSPRIPASLVPSSWALAGKILFARYAVAENIRIIILPGFRGLTHINGGLLPYVLAPRASLWVPMTPPARGVVVLPGLHRDPHRLPEGPSACT